MTVEIKLRRKYLEVTHGHQKARPGREGARRVRMPKLPTDAERIAVAQRAASGLIMVLLPNGKRRMRRIPISTGKGSIHVETRESGGRAGVPRVVGA